MPDFVPKNWRDSPDTGTPISAAALEDLEKRVTDYLPDSVVTDSDLEAGPVGIGAPANPSYPLYVYGAGSEFAGRFDGEKHALVAYQSVDQLGAANDTVNVFHTGTGDGVYVNHKGGKIPETRFTGDTTDTSRTVANVSSFAGLVVGLSVTGSGIDSGTTISAVDFGARTITLSKAATATASGVTITVTASGTAGGNAGVNVLTPFNLDSAGSGREGDIQNNRTGMIGAYLQTQATGADVRTAYFQHWGGGAALHIQNQDPSGGVAQGNGMALFLEDYSTASSLAIQKLRAPAAAKAMLELTCGGVGSVIESIRGSDTAGTPRFKSWSDGTLAIGNQANTPFGAAANTKPAVRLFIDMAGAGIQRTLCLLNSDSATAGDGTQIELDIGGLQYALIQGVVDDPGKEGSLRMSALSAAGSMRERLRLAAAGVGFNGKTPSQPTLPAKGVVTADDIYDALVGLGLCQ